MKHVLNWLNQPSKLPKSPPWWVVFLCGAVANLFQTHWFGVALCCSVCAGILLIDPLIEKFVGRRRI